MSIYRKLNISVDPLVILKVQRVLFHRVFLMVMRGVQLVATSPLDATKSYSLDFVLRSCSLFENRPVDINSASCFHQPDVMSGTVPKCPTCKGVVKPDIVFFGEELPRHFFKYLTDFPLADLLIVMGTSLEVSAASRLCHLMLKQYVGVSGDTETDSLYYRDVQNLGFLYLKVMFCPRLPLLNSDDADRK